MKSFFFFSKRKLIIPVIFLILFLSILFSTIYLNNQVDKYSCQIYELNSIALNKQNIQEKINNAVADLAVIKEETDELIQKNKPIFLFAIFSNRILDKIYIYPTDCSFTPENKLCNFYISKTSYNCIKSIISIKTDISALINNKIPEYRPINYPLLSLNLVIFLILGYLISCVIEFAYSKFKKK